MTLYPNAIDNVNSLPPVEAGSGIAAPVGPASGDLGGNYPNPLVTGIQGKLVPAPFGTNTLLSWTGSVLTWVAGGGGGGGITQLTGDITAGPGSGSIAATVVGIDGVQLSITSLTANQILQYNGTHWVNVAIPSGFTAGGDLTGTSINQTVHSVQGVVISGIPSATQVLTATSSTAAHWATPASGFTAGGDLSGTSTSQTVVGLNGTPIVISSLTTNNILQYNGTDWVNIAPPGATGTAGGDLSGSYPNPTVAKIDGASVPAAGSLTTGNVLQVSGASALSYGPVNLAGGANFVTGALPIANQAAQNLSGAVSGNTAASTINLTGNSSITGALPVANVAPGTSGQLLMSNGTPATTWTTLSGGATISATGVVTLAASSITLGGDVTGAANTNTVGKIQGNTVTSGALTEGQFLIATSTSNWAATSLSGDVTESASTPGKLTVGQLQGTIVLSGTPSTGQVLTATSSTAADWQTPAGGGGSENQSGLSTARPAATGSGIIYFCKDIPVLYFDKSSGVWEQYATEYMPAPVAVSSYTIVSSQGNMSITQYGDAIRAISTSNSTIGAVALASSGSLGASSLWAVTLCYTFTPNFYPADDCEMGICVTNGTTQGSSTGNILFMYTGTAGTGFEWDDFTVAPTSGGAKGTQLYSPGAAGNMWFASTGRFHMRLLNDGTTLHSQYSNDGFNWMELASISSPSGLTNYGFGLGATPTGVNAYGQTIVYENTVTTPTSYTATAATNANPSVITIGTHSILAGDLVAIHGVATAINTSTGTGSVSAGVALVTAVTTGPSGTITVASSGTVTFTSGGTVTLLSR